MAACTAALLVAVLLNSLQAQGSEVFVLHGNDLRLDVTAPVELNKITDFLWKFEKSRVVKFSYDKETIIFPTYKAIVDFIEGNYSLLLKNVQHKNSGIYKAVLSEETEVTVAEYKVTIQDVVSPVNLMVTSNNSSSSCNLTVTCSTEDSNISGTFQCDNQNCSLVKETNLTSTSQFSSIHVYLKQGSIICNHSNQVSWKHAEHKLESYCKAEPDLLVSAATTPVIGTVVPTVLLVVVVASVFIYRKCKRKNNENTENGISQEVEMNQHVYQDPAEDASDLNPLSTYALVQFPNRPGNSTETKQNLSNTRTHLPETVYAQVQRQDKD